MYTREHYVFYTYSFKVLNKWRKELKHIRNIYCIF